MKPHAASTLVNRLSFGHVKWGWWTSSFVSVARPIIIGGCGRSGTTLLRAMLNAHPRIHIGPETGLLCGALSFPDVAESLEIPEKELRRIHRRSACLGEFVDRVMDRVLKASGKARWGEKSPSNVLNIRVIFQFFPQARFIHMIRDGRDVVASLRDHPKYRWENGQRVPTGIVNPWIQCVGRWVRDTSAGLEWRDDGRCREVRYEDLVSNPETCARRLLEWLEEAWDPALLQFHSKHVERGSDVANPGVTSPVYSTATGRWQRDLPPEGRNAFTREAHALLINLGYAANDDWAGNGDDAASRGAIAETERVT